MTQHSRDTPQFYLTAPSPCPYLAGKEERKVFTHLVGERAPEHVGDLLERAVGGYAGARIGRRRHRVEALQVNEVFWVRHHDVVGIAARPEDAQDLTQDFFARVFEREYLARYDASKARFRTFVRTCLDGFVANHDKAAARLKRGGGFAVTHLDFAKADDKALNPGDRHVYWVVREVMQRGDTKVSCLSCHQIHAQSTARHWTAFRSRGSNPPVCLYCHSTEGKYTPGYTVHSAVCEY